MGTKKLSLFLILAFFAFSFVNLYSNTKTGSLLWKISGNDLKQPSYILGTFHLKSGEFLDSIAGAREAFENADQIIGEIEMNDMAAMQTHMQMAMLMLPDTTYRDLYSEEDYQFVNEQLTNLIGMGLNQLGSLKPAALNLTLSALIYQKLLQNPDPENTLDMFIQKEAKKREKEIKGLERMEQQTDILFNSSNLKRQAEILLCNLKNMDYIKNQALLILHDYNNMDLEKLYSYIDDENNPCPESDEENDALLKLRNDEWIKKIPQLIKEKSSFIAVGALHLPGDIGVLQQLENMGYSVDAVK